VLACCRLLHAQAPPAQSAPDAQETYMKLCSGCHGADAHGSQQGPGLAGNPSVGRRSVQNLRSLIVNGIPAAGMPAFPLPEATLNVLVALVKSLNAPAADSTVAGDRAAGKEFFFGKGQCVTCHMVYGAGEPVGPDLSNVARELSVDQIRQALLQPSAQTSAGYALATVRLRDGSTVRGFVRNRTRFDIQLQDLKGVFHGVPLDTVATVEEEKQSLMPPVKAAPAELQNLIAYLSSLSGVNSGAPTASRTVEGGIDFSRILNPTPGDWLTYNGNVNGNRYSELKQINAANVGKMSLRWTFSIPLWSQFLPDTPYYHENMRYFGLETVPLVADGVMYVTGPNQVFALDARNGHQIWHYSRARTPGIVSDASLGTNRGVALLGDKVFMTTDNAHLIALHRVTGRLLWEVVMPDEAQHYGSTMAPLIVKDMVIAGVSGGDWGVRGFLAAYKASSGERVWRHWTIPSAAGEPGFDTWKGTALKEGGGSTWLTGSYDPESDTLFWTTGNPYPNSDDRQRGGDNLFTNCLLALNPRTGEMKWYYQFTPHDTHDWDATTPVVLVNTRYRGQDRKLLLHADRNGFFYVFDRTDGRLLLAQKFVKQMTWASGVDERGRPVLLPDSDVTCPDTATNWNGTAYSPVTRLYYVMAIEKCQVRLTAGSWKKERPVIEPARKFLRALDIETGNIAWEIPEVGPTDGKRVAGVLGTAGGIVFYGDPSGEFLAVNERDGKTLWRMPLNSTIKTSPITYTAGGEQFVTLAAGANIMTFALPR